MRVSHAASGLVIAEAAYEQGPPKLEARISIHDDLFDDIGQSFYNGDSSVVAGMAFVILRLGLFGIRLTGRLKARRSAVRPIQTEVFECVDEVVASDACLAAD